MRPKCFGKISTLSYQERAENCCNDCKVQTECANKATNSAKVNKQIWNAALIYLSMILKSGLGKLLW